MLEETAAPVFLAAGMGTYFSESKKAEKTVATRRKEIEYELPRFVATLPQELQRLKKLAMERPPKIRRYSFLLLGCMLMLYMGIMGYQILGTM